ncbi:ATP-binding protein [Neptuniibacter sp. QD72_48]|uniref:PAS domain-containing sensor histidine kinase n=1 Tax=Neptuniibacter sp. QD72_48 TaxID=3398214 RepID=UPI0039F63FD6
MLPPNSSNTCSTPDQKLLEEIVHTYPQPIIVIDNDHRVLIWNKACEKVFGIPAQDVLGTKDQWKTFYPAPRPILADVVLDDDEEQLEQFYPGIHRRSPFIDDAYEVESFFPKLGSNIDRWLYFTAKRLYDEDGNVVGAIESLIDITERMVAEAEVKQLNESLSDHSQKLEEANEELKATMLKLANTQKLASLGKLVAGISHELNTPIGNIRTISSALKADTSRIQDQLNSGEMTKSALENFLSNVLESTDLIEKSTAKTAELILSCQQISSNDNEYKRSQLDLRDLVEEVLNRQTQSLSRSSIIVENLIPHNISMNSFAAPIQQIFDNLINNTRMHAFTEQQSGKIKIHAHTCEKAIKLIYTDSGCGIPTKNFAKVFDPFFTTKFGQGSNGLGLYIIFNLVTGALGGSIELQSPNDGGFELHITLPSTSPYALTAEDDTYYI